MNSADSSPKVFATSAAVKEKQASGIGSEYVTAEDGEFRRVQISKDVREPPKKLRHWYQPEVDGIPH
jgi:hypothetical protein